MDYTTYPCHLARSAAILPPAARASTATWFVFGSVTQLVPGRSLGSAFAQGMPAVDLKLKLRRCHCLPGRAAWVAAVGLGLGCRCLPMASWPPRGLATPMCTSMVAPPSPVDCALQENNNKRWIKWTMGTISNTILNTL